MGRTVQYTVEWSFDIEFQLDDDIAAESQEAKDMACEWALKKQEGLGPDREDVFCEFDAKDDD